MSDIEDRLRAALSSAMEQPPAGLLGAVRRRHRRRNYRVGAGMLAVAAAAAIAVPPLTGALRGNGPPSGDDHGAHLSRVLRAVPGTLLSSCADGPVNLGSLGRHWRGHEVALAHSGPVWILGAGYGHGRLSLWAAVVVLDGLPRGATAALRVAPQGRGQLRFLYGPKDSMNAAGTGVQRMRRGETGVTFEACPGHGPVPTPGITDYYGGFLVNGRHCVPVDVLVPGRRPISRIHLGFCAAR